MREDSLALVLPNLFLLDTLSSLALAQVDFLAYSEKNSELKNLRSLTVHSPVRSFTVHSPVDQLDLDNFEEKHLKAWPSIRRWTFNHYATGMTRFLDLVGKIVTVCPQFDTFNYTFQTFGCIQEPNGKRVKTFRKLV